MTPADGFIYSGPIFISAWVDSLEMNFRFALQRRSRLEREENGWTWRYVAGGLDAKDFSSEAVASLLRRMAVALGGADIFFLSSSVTDEELKSMIHGIIDSGELAK